MFKKKSSEEDKKTKDLKIDESQLSEEDKDESGLKIRKGLLIFCIVLLLIIIGLTITIVLMPK